jgi:hypothetical protein
MQHLAQPISPVPVIASRGTKSRNPLRIADYGGLVQGLLNDAPSSREAGPAVSAMPEKIIT